jgi:hypothetical protein
MLPLAKPAPVLVKKFVPAPVPVTTPVPVMNKPTSALTSVEIVCEVPTENINNNTIADAILKLSKFGNTNLTADDISATINNILKTQN